MNVFIVLLLLALTSVSCVKLQRVYIWQRRRRTANNTLSLIPSGKFVVVYLQKHRAASQDVIHARYATLRYGPPHSDPCC